MVSRLERNKKRIETASVKLTRWIGSTTSVIAHTLFFIMIMLMPFFGIGFEKILLILTTVVSLEAIYLSIFIQMTVNRHSQELEGVSEDIEEIQEDVEEIQEDVSEIQEDVEDIGEDIEEDESVKNDAMMRKIETTLTELTREIQELKNSKK